MYDYRKIEERNKGLQAEIDQILGKPQAERSADDGTRVSELMGQIHANDALAGELREAEVTELREIVARGSNLTAGEPTEAEAEERAYLQYIKGGEESIPAELRASMSTTDANGGYVVAEPLHGPMVEKVRKYNPICAASTLFELTGDTKMELPYKSAHGVATTATETGARAEQNAATIGNTTLECFDYWSDQRASQTFLDSAVINGQPAEAWMIEAIYGDIMEKCELDCVTGTGTTSATGLFSTAAVSYYATSLSGTANGLTNAAFLKWFFALHPKYRANGSWVMNSATLATAAGFVWPNTYDKLVTIDPNGQCRLMGKPVLECSDAPAIGDGAYPVAFGDIKAGYATGIHRNISILRDPYTATPKIRFYGLGRLGGTPWDPQAILLGKSDDA